MHYNRPTHQTCVQSIKALNHTGTRLFFIGDWVLLLLCCEAQLPKSEHWAGSCLYLLLYLLVRYLFILL